MSTRFFFPWFFISTIVVLIANGKPHYQSNRFKSNPLAYRFNISMVYISKYMSIFFKIENFLFPKYFMISKSYFSYTTFYYFQDFIFLLNVQAGSAAKSTVLCQLSACKAGKSIIKVIKIILSRSVAIILLDLLNFGFSNQSLRW